MDKTEPTLAQRRAGLERAEAAEKALLVKLAAATQGLQNAQRLEQRRNSEWYKASLLVKVARARVEAAEKEATGEE